MLRFQHGAPAVGVGAGLAEGFLKVARELTDELLSTLRCEGIDPGNLRRGGRGAFPAAVTEITNLRFFSRLEPFVV